MGRSRKSGLCPGSPATSVPDLRKGAGVNRKTCNCPFKPELLPYTAGRLGGAGRGREEGERHTQTM